MNKTNDLLAQMRSVITEAVAIDPDNAYLEQADNLSVAVMAELEKNTGGKL
jgi:hypothetical protein